MSGNREKPEPFSKKYREPGVEWTPDEFPLLLTRPIGYIYLCQRCDETFEDMSDIHIPLCNNCRARLLDETLERVRNGNRDLHWEE